MVTVQTTPAIAGSEVRSHTLQATALMFPSSRHAAMVREGIPLLPSDVRLIVAATVEEVLARRPVPTAVTLKQAAEMLGVSRGTAHKLRLRRNRTGLIPYEEVIRFRGAQS